MKNFYSPVVALLTLAVLSSAAPVATTAAVDSTTDSAIVQGDIMITRDPNEVKGMKKLGEIEGRSPFFGLSGKLGDKGATKKLKAAAAELGATKVLIVSEDRMGATTLRGIAYK